MSGLKAFSKCKLAYLRFCWFGHSGSCSFSDTAQHEVLAPHWCRAPHVPSSEHTMAVGPAGSVLAMGVEHEFSEMVISEGDFP